MKHGLIIGMMLLTFTAHSESLKGRLIEPSYYAPPMGNVACEMPGGHQYGDLTERFGEHGGTVFFEQVDMDHYLLTVQRTEGQAPASDSMVDEFLATYFSEHATPLLFKHYPGGALKEAKAITHQDNRLFYGVFYYPPQKVSSSVVGRKTRGVYRILILHLDHEFVYTITHTDPSFPFSEGHTESPELHPELLQQALYRLAGCHFFDDVSQVTRISPKVTVKPIINIEMIDAIDATGQTHFRIKLDEASLTPEEFIAAAQQWQVEQIYFPHGKAPWAECVLAMAKQIGADVYWGIEGTDDEFQQIEGSFKVATHCQP